jgi:GT2 family glycosyltransferase
MGIRHANGSLIAILNMDTEVDPHWISELVKVATSNSKIGACGGKIYDYLDRKTLQFPDPIVIPSESYDKIQDVWSIYGAGFLVKRDVLELIGLFDPEYFCYYEEIDLCWRIRLAGFRVVFVPKAVMYHFQGGAQIARKPLIYLNFKNRLRTILKNCQIETLPLYLPILALQVGFALLLLFHPRKKKARKEGLLRIEAYIKASLWNLLKLRNTIKERAKIQRLRKVSDRQLRVISTDLIYLLLLHKRPIYI